jgi:hypothetical protein
VLLSPGLEAKVSDFGLAKLCDREASHLTVTGARVRRAGAVDADAGDAQV